MSQFPPFRIDQPVRSLKLHVVTSQAQFGPTTFNVHTGTAGTLGYYWNDGWKFSVLWDSMPECPVTYAFSDWTTTVGPVSADATPPPDLTPMYARDLPTGP